MRDVDHHDSRAIGVVLGFKNLEVIFGDRYVSKWVAGFQSAVGHFNLFGALVGIRPITPMTLAFFLLAFPGDT